MTLYVQETGSHNAETVFFLHAIAVSGWMWRNQLAAVGDYHCLVIDLPGHGRSNAEKWLSFADTGEQVAAIIRTKAAAGKAHVVGLSLGSYVIAQMLNDHPDLIDHAVMSGVNVLPLPNPAMMKIMSALMMPFIKTNYMINMNIKALNIPADAAEEYRQNTRLTSRQAFWQASSDAAEFRLPPKLSQAANPTLIVAGEHEHPLIHQSAALMVNALPNAQAWIAPGVGHGWNGEAPDLFNWMLRAWFSDQPLPAEMIPLQQFINAKQPIST